MQIYIIHLPNLHNRNKTQATAFYYLALHAPPPLGVDTVSCIINLEQLADLRYSSLSI